MDTSYLKGWDIEEQNKRVVFIAHMYKCSGREDKDHPLHGVYTGLWQNFCLQEAGPTCREMFFDRIKAIQQFVELEEQKQTQTQTFIPTLHD